MTLEFIAERDITAGEEVRMEHNIVLFVTVSFLFSSILKLLSTFVFVSKITVDYRLWNDMGKSTRKT